MRKEPKEQRDCSTCPHLLMMMKQHCRISVNFLEIVFCLLATDSGERESCLGILSASVSQSVSVSVSVALFVAALHRRQC